MRANNYLSVNHLILNKHTPVPSGFKKFSEMVHPVKVREISIELGSNRRGSMVSKRGSMIIDDQALMIKARRGSKLSVKSKNSRRHSQANLEVHKLEPPIGENAFDLMDEVVLE